MRFMYGAADEKYIEKNTIQLTVNRVKLNRHRYCENDFLVGNRKIQKGEATIDISVSPDTLLALATIVANKLPLPNVMQWTNTDCVNWIRRYGYKKYQNAFRANEINGRTLLLLDATSLPALNIRNFQEIKHISYGIRELFCYQLIRYNRDITLAPYEYADLYKLMRIKTGVNLNDMRHTDLYRKMSIIRSVELNLTHWDKLIAHLNFVKNDTYYLTSRVFRKRLPRVSPILHNKQLWDICECVPPCECNWTEREYAELQLKTLDPLKSSKSTHNKCYKCSPPCVCDWDYHSYQPNAVFTVLESSFPRKYAGLTHPNESVSRTSASVFQADVILEFESIFE